MIFSFCNLSFFYLFYSSAFARAVTGRGAHTVGRGETFCRVDRDSFKKTAITRERKVEKSISRWEMNRLSEGYRQAVDQNWGRMAKIGLFGQKRDFGPKKSVHFLGFTMFWARPEKVVQRKKLPFPKKISVS